MSVLPCHRSFWANASSSRGPVMPRPTSVPLLTETSKTCAPLTLTIMENEIQSSHVQGTPTGGYPTFSQTAPNQSAHYRTAPSGTAPNRAAIGGFTPRLVDGNWPIAYEGMTFCPGLSKHPVAKFLPPAEPVWHYMRKEYQELGKSCPCCGNAHQKPWYHCQNLCRFHGVYHNSLVSILHAISHIY